MKTYYFTATNKYINNIFCNILFLLQYCGQVFCTCNHSQTSKQERERERNVLFNDALNTFYLRLYGVRHMVKDHSDSEKENPLPPHRLLLSINSKGSFICTPHRQNNTYHSLCYTSRGALAGTRNSSMGPPHEGSIRRPTAPRANALPMTYVPLQTSKQINNK